MSSGAIGCGARGEGTRVKKRGMSDLGTRSGVDRCRCTFKANTSALLSK